MSFSAAVFLHREMDNAKTNKKRTVVLGNCSVSAVYLQCETEVSVSIVQIAPLWWRIIIDKMQGAESECDRSLLM